MEDLILDAKKIHILRIHETQISNNTNNYKVNIINRQYCGEYEELILCFDKDQKSQIKLRVYLSSGISLDKEIYLEINQKKIISVKN